MKILPCNCTHEFQDSRYGFGNRVHNVCKSAKLKDEFRCTVCGKLNRAKVTVIEVKSN